METNMKTWNDYKEHVKKIDPVAKKEIKEAEKNAIAYEISQGINQAIQFEQGKIEAKVTVLSDGKKDR